MLLEEGDQSERMLPMRKTIFLYALALWTVLSVAGCIATAGFKAGISGNLQLKIIDAHTHCVFDNTPEKTSRIMQSKEEYLKEMKENNVVGAIAHTGYLGDFHEDLRGRNIIFCYGIGDKINDQEVESVLKSRKYGCIKIYLGYYHRWANDEEYKRIYKLAEAYDVPVVFHTGDTYSAKAKLKYADPMTIDEVAVDHPNVRFVIAHCGNPWIQTAAEVAYKNANVYLDVSGIMVGDLNSVPREMVDDYLVKPVGWVFHYVGNPSKMLYGSDWPLVNMGQYIDAIKRAIPEEHWKAFFHDNAVSVFRLKPSGLPRSP
jgi:hypothetical protein